MSFHVIEGEAELILFNDAGDITQVVPMGDLTTGRRFYCRIPKSQYYTQLITSDYVVLHETIIGPHERELTSWAPWAPDQEVDQASRDYLARLKSETGAFISAAGDAHLT